MIPTDKIRDLIGKGGATIRGIVEQTGAKIDVDDTGRVSVASSDAEGLKKALAMISDITAVPEIGKIYLGKVVRLAEFGAFVELFPGTDGLLHISEIAEHRVKEVKDELREGDQVMVKVLAIEGNRIKLSRKALIKEQKAKLAQQQAAPPLTRGSRELAASAARAPAALRARRATSSTSVSRSPTRAPSSLRAATTSTKKTAKNSTRRTSPTSTAPTALRQLPPWRRSPSAGRRSRRCQQQQPPPSPSSWWSPTSRWWRPRLIPAVIPINNQGPEPRSGPSAFRKSCTCSSSCHPPGDLLLVVRSEPNNGRLRPRIALLRTP